ncbi:MAG: response regulator [Saprospiraceae bacterium]
MRYLLSLALLFSVQTGKLISQSLMPESLTIDDGLSQGMVFDILQTRDGFLWIATKGGLNRYDGYNFKVWDNDPKNPYSSIESIVTTLFEDSRNWLWAGYGKECVQLFDRKTDRFYRFNLPKSANHNNQTEYDIRQITEDRHGHIWIVSRVGGVFRLKIPKSWSRGFPDKPDLSSEVVFEPVRFSVSSRAKSGDFEEFRTLLHTQTGEIWMGTSQQLYLIDAQSLLATPIPNQPLLLQHWNLIQQPTGEIWGACSDHIFRYQKGVFTTLPLISAAYGEGETYPVLTFGKGGELWLLYEKSLWKIPKDGVLTLRAPDCRIDRLGNELFQDKLNNLWVGTLGYGLRKIILRRSQFNTGMEGISVWRVWQSKRGEIWCNLFNKIVEFDPLTGKASQQSAFPDAPPQQNDLIFDPDGSFWLLCGLREGNINFSEVRHYRSDKTLIKSYPISIGRYPYARLMRDRDGKIWISGASGKLLKLDPATGSQKVYDASFLFKEDAQTIFIIALTEDNMGQLWLGTQYGLVKGLRKGDQLDFQLIEGAGINGRSPNNNSIASILQDPHHPDQLWIGTKGGGVNWLNIKTGAFSYLTEEDGLPNDIVYGVLAEKNRRNYWCSTNRGLARITMDDKDPIKITSFTVSDGLQSNEFNTQSFSTGQDGSFLFGGVNGFNRFFPENLEFDNNPPQVYIVGVKVNQKNLRFSVNDKALSSPVEYANRLELDYTRNNLSFEFSSMDFTDPKKNQYLYQLLPIEKEWIPARNDHFAHYTHLAPGNYTLRVRGSNSVGVWNETPVEMTIVISPPWWRSKLAYALYLLAAAVAVWQAWRFQVYRFKVREQLAAEQRETERLKAVEQMKTNFFNNITHEFRTPLSLILEPARRIKLKIADPEVRENASRIENNSLRLLNMVNQLLDIAKLENGSMTLDLKFSSISGAIREIYRTFLPLAEKKNIKLSLSIDPDIPEFFFDYNKVELTLNNLISNALKFTPKSGSISISAAISPLPASPLPSPACNQPAQAVVIKVSDTGIGIPKAALDRVFERFYQVSATEKNAQLTTHTWEEAGISTGTGIGLALSKELTEMMGGILVAESPNPLTGGQGTVFSFWLPMRYTAAVEPDDAKEFPQEAILSQSDVVADASPEPPSAAIPSKATQDKAGKRIEKLAALVIEDNADLRAFIKASIREQWQVLEATNGEEGIQTAIELIPDLVITDLMMPLKDGYVVCDELKNNELTAHIPIILLTAKASLDAKLKGLRKGADDYLTKPFHTEELLARMDNLVEIRQKLRERFSKQSLGTSISDSPDNHEFLSPPDKEFLRRFILMLEENLNNVELGIDDFAKKMFLSRSQLHRKTRALTDQNPTEFIKGYRLEKAMSLLKNREGGISEIATRVGFSNEKYFSTVFKEKFGVSPSRV